MSFSITADHLFWINGTKDDPEDLCLHSHAVAIIGNQRLEYEATVSATALYLLKTLTEDHIIFQDNQLLPCCGFYMIPNKELDNVTILGCPNGIDWSVVHHDDNSVTLELEDGTKEIIAMDEYKAEVCRFADSIESFYMSCSPKVIPEDTMTRDGYFAFWNEWHRRRGK